MARGRLLTIELLNDERLNQMSEKAQRSFMRAWAHLDRDGRITGNPRRLWAQIDVDHIENMDKMAGYIEEWIAAGLVMRYESGKGLVLFFIEFRLHNLKLTYTEEAVSIWPPPPAWHNTKQGPIPNCPERAERMAENISTNCHYKTELLRHARSPDNDLHIEGGEDAATVIAALQAKITKLETDLTVNLNQTPNGRLAVAVQPVAGREDQYQDQQEIVVDVALSFSPSAYQCGGRIDHLALCEESDLRRSAWELGIALFGYAWTNYEAFVARQPSNIIIQLLEWIAYYSEATLEQTERIRDMPAILRAHINKDEHAMLRRPQRATLLETVQNIGNHEIGAQLTNLYNNAE